MRRAVFDNLHSLSQPRIKASRRLVSERYVWPNMRRHIAAWTRTCHDCQQSKVHRHIKAPLQTFPAPDSRFDSIHVDIVGPLIPSKGNTYLFTCIDRYTRWTDAIPMPDAMAESCLDGSHALLCQERLALTGESSLGPNFGIPL